MAIRPIAELVEEILSLPDTAEIEIPENYMPNNTTYSWCRINNGTVRPMVAKGIDRELIEKKTLWRNNSRQSWPDTYYIAKIEVPHVTSVNHYECTCGCVDLLGELAKAANEAGLTASYDCRTSWWDR